MINVKYYIHEERPVVGGLTEMKRKQVTYAEALKIDEKFGEDLKRLEAAYPGVKAKYDELDAKAIEAARETQALILAKSPRLVESQRVLRKLVSERETIMQKFRKERSDALLGREALNRPLLNAQLEAWRERRITLGATIDIEETVEKPHLFGKTDYVVRSNRAALAATLDFLIQKEASLRAMRVSPLCEIKEFIDQTEVEFSNLDPNAQGIEKVDEGQFKVLRETEAELKSVPENPSTVYKAGPDQVRVGRKGVA